MAQWWERSPATNVAQVQIPALTPHVGWVRCSFSPLLREVFLWVLQFSPLLKNQHFQIPIWPGIRQTKNHFVDVLPPNHYSSIYLSCNQAVYLKTARVRGHVQGSHKGSWPFTSQVDYKVRRRAQNMSGCQNCHQQGRWHVEWREKMRDCIYPFLTSRLSKHKKKNKLNGTVRVDDAPGKAVHYYKQWLTFFYFFS